MEACAQIRRGVESSRICEAPSKMLYLGGGGGGINSTAASHAFVTDTWFMQANGKVLGAHHPV